MAVEIVDGGFALDEGKDRKKYHTGLIMSGGSKEGPVDKSTPLANETLSSNAVMFGRFLNARERQSPNKGRSIEDLLAEFEMLSPDLPEGFSSIVLNDGDLIEAVKIGYNQANEFPSLGSDEFDLELPYHKNLDMEGREPYESTPSGDVDPVTRMESPEFNPFDLIRSKNIKQTSR